MDEIATLSADGSENVEPSFIDVVRPTSVSGRVMVAFSSGIMRRDLDRRAQLMKAALEGVAGRDGSGD